MKQSILFLLVLFVMANVTEAQKKKSKESEKRPETVQSDNKVLLAPPVKVATVEGITEYRLQNGLKVLLFPDESKQTITVNITYMVGSKHENYGETGMAHLLEHLVFKGTPNTQISPRSSLRMAPVRTGRHGLTERTISKHSAQRRKILIGR
jgi:zinc protease